MLTAVAHALPLVSTVQQLLLQTLPHGGQRGARRNAWASMSADAATARARRDAAAAMSTAMSTAGATATARDAQPVRTAR